jgi:hypothetical protein
VPGKLHDCRAAKGIPGEEASELDGGRKPACGIVAARPFTAPSCHDEDGFLYYAV